MLLIAAALSRFALMECIRKTLLHFSTKRTSLRAMAIIAPCRFTRISVFLPRRA